MVRSTLVVMVCGLVGLASCGSNTSAQGYVGATEAFVAWADTSNQAFFAAPANSYAGKKQALRGSTDYLSGAHVDGVAGVEVYKGDDGHIYALDLSTSSKPEAKRLSNESSATIDDLCSLSGTAAGGNLDYAGVLFAGDLQTPTSSAYIYRLPGPDSVCNSGDDVVHMVRTGMSPSDEPLVVPAMPVAVVRSATGGVAGYVVKQGAELVLFDTDFTSPTTLGTFASAIGVAEVLPNGRTEGYPTSALFVVDGTIVSVDYSAHTISQSLFAIPGWTPTSNPAITAASASTLFFAINSAASSGNPASVSIYAMPSDGSAVPTVVDHESGRVNNMGVAIGGSNLVFGVVAPTYTLRLLENGQVTTLATAPSGVNGGNFMSTTSAVYYTTWTQTTNTSAQTRSRTATSSGIVGLDGSVIQAPFAGSSFISGGEQQVWPDDMTTVAVPYEALFQVQGLAPVTVTDASGIADTYDGVAGGTLVAIDTTTNTPGDSLGTLAAGSAVTLDGTFRGDAHIGFIEATNPASTTNPNTRDLYLIDSHGAGSLRRVTKNL